MSSPISTEANAANSMVIDSRFQSARLSHPAVRLQARLAASRAVFRYQRQIDLRSGRIAGVETILCVPTEHGFRRAVELRAELDSAGMGAALLDWQLREACREKSAWLKSFPHDFPVAVPVSPGVSGSVQLLALALQVLAHSDLAPAYLELEIEESAWAASAQATRSLSGLRDAGMSVAIDGFNAAHSNLRLLASLPAAKLRVDAMPLLRQSDNASERRVFDAIVAVANGLGILLCATNVNSANVLAAVVRQARPLAQGTELGGMLDGPGFLQSLRDRNETTTDLPVLTSAGPVLTSARDEPALEPARIAAYGPMAERSLGLG